MIKSIRIEEPSREMLETSIKNNIFFYYVSLFTWIGFLLYGSVFQNNILILDSIVFLACAINFNLAQKIDKLRLEFLKKC